MNQHSYQFLLNSINHGQEVLFYTLNIKRSLSSNHKTLTILVCSNSFSTVKYLRAKLMNLESVDQNIDHDFLIKEIISILKYTYKPHLGEVLLYVILCSMNWTRFSNLFNWAAIGQRNREYCYSWCEIERKVFIKQT
jgi:hypothetical protein